jgi:hypothetical protein
MSDDLKNRGPRDRSRVNVHEAWELEYWTKHFGVSATKLKQAVGAVGVMVTDISAWLRTH